MFLERADNTARILDVKYFVLLPQSEVISGGKDNYRWGAILRSVSAHRSYRWVYKENYKPWRFAEYLILNAAMPRSLSSCCLEIEASLSGLTEFYGSSHACHATARQTVELLASERIEPIFQMGLHEFIEDFVRRNNQLGLEIADAYHFGH